MTAPRLLLPWSAPAVIVENDIPRHLPVGTVLNPDESRTMFGDTWDVDATYIVAADGRAYRVVDHREAWSHNLNHIFTGTACHNGHIAPRTRVNRKTPVCVECRRLARRRSRKVAA